MLSLLTHNVNCANDRPAPYHSPTKARMCVHPILIKNPYFGMADVGVGFMKDTVNKYITIPCRHCPECYANMQMQLVQRVQMECLDSHCFFCTLTYNEESMPHVYLPRTDGRPGSHDIRFSDVSDVQNMMKRLRRRDAFGRPFRYLAVSELGSKRARPHFHILFFLPILKTDYDSRGSCTSACVDLEYKMFKAVLKEWRRNYSNDWRKPDYRPLCTFIRKWTKKGMSTTYDLHYCNPKLSANGVADVGFYVTKYMTKPSDKAVRLQQALKLNLEEDQYERIWSAIKPRFFASIGFGVNPEIDPKSGRIVKCSDKIVKYLKSCVQRSIGVYHSPRYINPVDGSTFPLSRYYYQFPEIYSFQDSLSFWFMDPVPIKDNVNDFYERRDVQTMIQKEKSFNQRTRKKIDSNYFDFDSLF